MPRQIFHAAKVFIGVVHLLPLPWRVSKLQRLRASYEFYAAGPIGDARVASIVQRIGAASDAVRGRGGELVQRRAPAPLVDP